MLFVKKRTHEEGTFAFLSCGVNDEEVIGDFASEHTAEEALHSCGFWRSSALIIQFCRKMQNKLSHGDVEGTAKAGKALRYERETLR